MKSFKQFINEETMPFAQTDKGFVGVDDPAVRDNINSLLSSATAKGFVTPYIALEKVGKVLANFHIFLPKYTFMEGDEGSTVFPVNQFGEKMGMTDDGKVVTAPESDYFIYFEYMQNENGMFDIFAEVVDQDELDELMDEEEDAEDLDEEYVSENYHSSYSDAIQTAVNAAKKRGYEVDQDDYHQKVSSGPRKPSEGKTVSHHLKLTKDGKPSKKGLAIQVYNRGGDKAPYELNHYISEEAINEVGDTEKGRAALEKYAAKAHMQTGYKSKLSPKEKKRAEFAKKALEIVDKKSGKKTLRSDSPLYDYDEEVNYKLNEVSRGMLSRYISKAKSSSRDAYYGSDAPTSGKRKKGIDLALLKKWGDKKHGLPEPKVKATNEAMSPAREGEIAAGRKGSNPAEQGMIAVKKDDMKKKLKLKKKD